MSRRIANSISALLHFLTPVRILIIVAVGAFFWFIVLGDQGLYQLERLLEMRERFTAERKSLNDEIDRLAQEKELLSDPANLETVIRKELGYIKPGEVIFEEKRDTTVVR